MFPSKNKIQLIYAMEDQISKLERKYNEAMNENFDLKERKRLLENYLQKPQ